jgi:ABC-2 type transport system ATP-binding protein
MAIVDVENLTREFAQGKSKTIALRDLTMDVEDGEVFGLLGPNGAGKTTLVNILGGVLTPSSGKARIFGLDVERQMNKIIDRINICSGETQFHWALKGRQILNFYGRVYGLTQTEREKRIAYLSERFEAKDLLDKKFGWYSSGQKMRLILCKALLNEPEFLMMDEPTLRLDPDIAKKTRELVTEINKEQGVTILLASHYMAEVEQLCHRIAFLHKGRLIDIGDIDKVKSLHFSTYSVRVKLRRTGGLDAAKLGDAGFILEPEEGVITKQLTEEGELAGIIEGLIHGGYDILDIRTVRPSLEDYFLKMVEGREEFRDEESDEHEEM